MVTSTQPRAMSARESTVQKAKVATSIAFVLNGFTFATWASRIPDVRTALDLTPGDLGLLLLFGAAGSLIGLPLAGWVASRIGTRQTVLLGGALSLTGLAVVGVTAGVAHSYALTAMTLFVTMAGIGQWDVAMNLEGSAVEHHLKRNIMPRFHAGFSLGAVLAALFGAGLVALHVPFVAHFVVVAALIAAGLFVATRAFLPRAWETETDDTTPEAEQSTLSARGAWLEPRTLLIGLVMLVSAFTEGAANDWISVAFVDGYDLPAWAGVLGFATFLSFMTLGRLVGANMLDRWGRIPVLRVMLIAAGIGSLGVVFGTPVTAFIGAAIWGFGVSLGFPVGMSAAADDPRHAAVRVSVVSTIAYGAFLIGPPALGFLGDHWGVLRSLSVVSAMIILALLALPAMRQPEGTRS